MLFLDVYTVNLFLTLSSLTVISFTPVHCFSLCPHPCLTLRTHHLTPEWTQWFHSSPYLSLWSKEPFWMINLIISPPFITHLIGLIGSEPLMCHKALQWPDACLSLQLHLLPPFPCLPCLSQTHLLQVQECVLLLPVSGLSHAVPSPWNALILCPSAPHLLTPLMLIYPVSSSKSASSGNPFLVFQKRLDTFLPLPCPFVAWISICNYLVMLK